MTSSLKKTGILFAAVLFLLADVTAQMHGHSNRENYRGRRMMPDMSCCDIDEKAFFVERISIKDAHHHILINLSFSFPLDPLSVKTHNIYLNGNPLPNTATIKFNRMGNVMQLAVKKETFDADFDLNQFKLSCGGICRFDGTPMGDRHYTGLDANATYIFSE